MPSLRIAILLLASTFVGCEATGCTPTQTEAKEGAVVNVVDVRRSSVLEATLTTEGTPLPAKTMEFWMRHADGERLVGESDTNASGVAAFDLKSRLPVGYVKDVAAVAVGDDYFEARFDGDATYCSSADEAPVKVVKT